MRGLTAEALSKDFLIKKYSDLCELCVSAGKQGSLRIHWIRIYLVFSRITIL